MAIVLEHKTVSRNHGVCNVKPSESIATTTVCRVIMAEASGKFSDERGDVQGWVFLNHRFPVEKGGQASWKGRL